MTSGSRAVKAIKRTAVRRRRARQPGHHPGGRTARSLHRTGSVRLADRTPPLFDRCLTGYDGPFPRLAIRA